MLSKKRQWGGKRGVGGGAAAPQPIAMYMGIASAERIHMNSVYLYAGRMMFETNLRGFKKREAPGPPFANRMPVSWILKNSTLRLCA